MTSYRIYLMAAGHIEDVEVRSCGDDAEALAYARGCVGPFGGAEVWDGGRKVGEVAPVRDGLCRYRLDAQSRLVDANGEALQVWGRRRHEILGAPISEVFPGAADQEAMRVLQEALASGVPATVRAALPRGGAGQSQTELEIRPVAGGLNVTFRPPGGPAPD